MREREKYYDGNDLWLAVFIAVAGWLLIFQSGIF